MLSRHFGHIRGGYSTSTGKPILTRVEIYSMDPPRNGSKPAQADATVWNCYNALQHSAISASCYVNKIIIMFWPSQK